MESTVVNVPATTTAPAGSDGPDRPRSISSRTLDDWLTLGGAGIASLCLVWLLYTQVLPFSGKLGFFLCWYVAFVVTVRRRDGAVPAAANRARSGCFRARARRGRGRRDRARQHGGVHVRQGLAGLPPLELLHARHVECGAARSADAGRHSARAWSDRSSSSASRSRSRCRSASLHAIYMTEVGGRFSRIVRTVVEAMTALPDLVAGLFVYAFLIIALGGSRTGFAAAVALSITMLPIIARSSEVVLRVVPERAARGQPRSRRTPVADGAGRGAADRPARAGDRADPRHGPRHRRDGAGAHRVGASTYFNANPFTDPMNSLPLFVFSGVRSPDPNSITRGYGAASVLLALVIILFAIIRLLARQRGHDPMKSPTTIRTVRTTVCVLVVSLVAFLSAAGSVAATASARPDPRARDRVGRPTLSTSGSPTCTPTVCRSSSPRTVRPKAARTSPTRPPTSPSATSASRAPTRRPVRTTRRRAAGTPTCRSSRAVRRCPTTSRSAGSWSATSGSPGETIAKIFTQQITNWNDPAITADNNGHALPSIPIIPVVHSEGSGRRTSSPAISTSCTRTSGSRSLGTRAPPSTSRAPSGSAVAENGSDGVMNFISSGAANGAIGYDEYSYALGKNYPVAKVLNSERLLHAAEPVQRRRRADPGRRSTLNKIVAGLPAAEPRPRVHVQRPADLPDLVVLVRDHPDRGHRRRR